MSELRRDRLIQTRERLGLTLEQADARLGARAGLVADYESGHIKSDAEWAAQQFGLAYGIESAWLLGQDWKIPENGRVPPEFDPDMVPSLLVRIVGGPGVQLVATVVPAVDAPARPIGAGVGCTDGQAIRRAVAAARKRFDRDLKNLLTHVTRIPLDGRS